MEGIMLRREGSVNLPAPLLMYSSKVHLSIQPIYGDYLTESRVQVMSEA